MYILDIETDGLMDTVTKIHCAVIRCVETNEVYVYDAKNLSKLPEFLDTLPELSCHNGIGFDLKVLKKFLNYTYKGVYRDTLSMSRILWPDMLPVSYIDEKGKMRSIKAPHSIESWGIRFDIKKPEHEDWSVYTPEMLHRCIEDTKIQAKLYQHIKTHQEKLEKQDDRIRLEPVWEMEQRFWALIEEQADYGWKFDKELGIKTRDELQVIVDNVKDKLVKQLPITVKQNGVTCKAFKKDGQLSSNALKWIQQKDFLPGIECYISDICGDFSKVIYEKFNLNSSAQIKKYLLENGWKPTEWNYKKDRHDKPLKDARNRKIKTSPKSPDSVEAWDEIALMLDNPNISLLAEFNKASHRLSSINGYFEKIRPDGRLEAQANTCGTNTTRATHKIIVNVPKAEEGVYYGKEMRSLFIADKGKVLVGGDASALEARCEAHYLFPFDPDSSRELLEGDIHTKNAAIFGTTRSKAKNGKYAILYGCAAPKLAATLGKPLSMAQQIYDAYWNGNPGLKELKRLLEIRFHKNGYILSIDGRPLTVRYKHALLNTLFQSCGSITMKRALCILDKHLEKRYVKGIDFGYVGNFHDEIQIETFPEHAEDIGKLITQSIRESGESLSLNVPMDGEYKIGVNWSVTH